MTTGVLERTAAQPADPPTRRWEGVALLGILGLAAVLYCWGIGDRALQPYYAAAIRSMTENGKAFLLGGFDPAGVVSIDKTPFAFWIQGIGVWIFGYHWWAIALVQAIEGVAAVFVLHRVVRRWAGERPALVAALILAVSPISTAIDRVNQADGLMVLLLLLAAYCVTRAVERASVGKGTGWLVSAGVFVGLAFFAKMLAGWILLPALAITYLAAPISWPKRLLRLLLAGVVTAVVSLAWPIMIGLWPAGDRPYIGSTSDNSIWQLIFGYNGFGRVAGGSIGSLGSLGSTYGSQFSAAAGPLRLFGSSLAGQIGWLLPLALATVLGAIIVLARKRGGTPQQRAGWLLWGGWLIVAGLVFSFAGGIFHRYYTVELAPAIAALAAVGLSACWGWYRAGRAAGLLLPLAILGSGAFAFVTLAGTPDWLPWLRFAVAIATVLAVLLLLGAFPGRRLLSVPARPVVALGVIALLAGPLAFSVDTMLTPQTVITAADPAAGPTSNSDMVTATAQGALRSSKAAQAYLGFMDQAATLTPGQREVLTYVTAHAPNARIQLAVELGSWGADPFLVNSSARVAAFGGYIGVDPSPTTTQVAQWAKDHQLGYVLLPAPLLEIGKQVGAPSPKQATSSVDTNTLDARITWVTHHCAPVRPALIGPDATQAGLLFSCG
ncbi:MAG TPA: glycosyltransferase family 39 protein [Pseudonocardiaceae bacterium]